MLSNYLPTSSSTRDYVLVEIERKPNGLPMFQDGLDRAYLVSLFQRYLTTNRPKFVEYSPYKNYSYDIELVAFALTDDKVSILMYQLSVGGFEQYIRSIVTSYVRYYARRYNQTMTLFRKPRVAYLTDKEAVQTSRIIHRQAGDWRRSRYSSLGFYINERRGDWVKPFRITNVFEHSASRYLDYMHQTD